MAELASVIAALAIATAIVLEYLLRHRVADLDQMTASNEVFRAKLQDVEVELEAARFDPKVQVSAITVPYSREEMDLLAASACSHCGGSHAIACPRVKRMRFRSDGSTIIEVEFWADGEWDKSRVVWLEDLPNATP